MLYEKIDFDPWYADSSLIVFLKNLGSVNISDCDKVNSAILSLKEIGRNMFVWLDEHVTFFDDDQLLALKMIYWNAVNNLEQHEGICLPEAEKALFFAKSTLRYVMDILLFEYSPNSNMICFEMQEAVKSLSEFSPSTGFGS
jgi:hypothetical protein